jgi:hypothetical protein
VDHRARDLTERLIDERDRRSGSARRRAEELAARRAVDSRAAVDAYDRVFFELASLAETLLRHHQSHAELVTISHWRPRSALMERLFPLRPEEIAAWEVARGTWGPYHPHHDLTVDTYDDCRVMVTADGRILFGVHSSVGRPERFHKPAEYRVVSEMSKWLDARLATCGLETPDDVRRRLAEILDGSSLAADHEVDAGEHESWT